MTKINEMLLKLEGFQYDTSLKSKLGYYHIQLSKNKSNLCTNILIWGNTGKIVYQWGMQTQKVFSSRKRMIYFMDLKSSIYTYMIY